MREFVSYLYIAIPLLATLCNLFLLMTFLSARKDKLIRRLKQQFLFQAEYTPTFPRTHSTEKEMQPVLWTRDKPTVTT